MSLEVALRHGFGAFILDVAFAAPPGLTALFGRSGAGKTSIVNAIAGLLRPRRRPRRRRRHRALRHRGWALLPRHRRRVGYVFQEGRLFPHLSVRQNLVFGRWFAPRGAASADFGHIVDLLGIGHLLDRGPGGALGRREAAGGHRPGAARRPAPPAHGRAARLARRDPQGRDPALPRAAPRRRPGADHLRQPRDRRGGAARHDGRCACRRPGGAQRPGAAGAVGPGSLPRPRSRGDRRDSGRPGRWPDPRGRPQRTRAQRRPAAGAAG